MHPAKVLDVVFNKDGTRLASASYDQTAKLWYLSKDLDNQPMAIKLVGHEKEVTTIAHHPKGRHLASADINGTVNIWDLSATDRYAADPIFSFKGP